MVCVGTRPGFRRSVDGALADLVRGSGRSLGGARPEPARWREDDRYLDVVARARGFLDRHLPTAEVRVVHAARLADVPRELAGRGDGGVALLLVDADGGALGGDELWPAGQDEIESVTLTWPPAARPELSPYGVYVYGGSAKPQVQPVARYTLRRLPTEEWVLAADVVCAFTDHVEVRHVRPAIAGGPMTAPTTLAAGLHAFLTARAGRRWGLWTYTGSVVSGLIADLERMARASGNPILRGPSEHSLACGALARWMLDEAPFVIVVTSGMVDEFRGTLANLRQARARGFIVCADSPEDRWGPFQGTVHADEDSREVLRARRLRAAYLSRSGDLDRDMEEAFAAYDADDGPVVMLATPSVLESRAAPPAVPASPVEAPRPSVRLGREDPVDAVTRILNTEPATLLWQVGAVDPGDHDLLHEAARRTGAALADSLTRPGSVSRYPGGRESPNYLGTLGLYGFSARIYEYLHRDGRLRPRDSQCLFFLGSRIAEICTPFSARALRNGLRVVQVTADERHLAPFADHPVHSDLRAFLRRVLDRLDVDDEVLALRHRAIRSARDVTDPLATLPVHPMTVNYFLHRLNAVVEDLIRHDGYRYTGVFDVGRGGAAAIRNLVRTGPGFSGWYGRALMGDALQAVPSIALTRPDNVLAFIGDGAAALVPDMLPSLLQQICLDGHRLHGNVSVFRLLNGGHSLIRTYREARNREPAGGQTTVLNLLEDDWTRTIGPVRVTHRQMEDIDRETLVTELTAPGTVNLYSVLLAHNNEGDGLSLLTTRSWHHAAPEPAEPGSPYARLDGTRE